MRAKILLAFAFVAAPAACDLTGPDFQHAVATFNCGPADGPATAILLARRPIESLQPSYPFIGVNIWQPVSSLSGTSWRADGSDQVTAQYFTAPGVFQLASAGVVRIDRVGTDNRVEGSISLRFPARFVSDAFSAPWMERLVLCG